MRLVLIILVHSLLIFNKGLCDDFDVRSLSGVDSLGVLVEKLSEDAKKAGIFDGRIKTVVELELRKVGMKVVDNCIPFLYVSISFSTRELYESRKLHICSIIFSFNQVVNLSRNKNIHGIAETWRRTWFYSGGDELKENIEKYCIMITEEFINDYMKANQEK